MKKFLMCVAALILAAFCIGWSPKYDISYTAVRVGANGTWWDIAEANYGKNQFYPVIGMCFEEYAWNVRNDAKNERLTANGRVLQPGDVVYVPIFKHK